MNLNYISFEHLNNFHLKIENNNIIKGEDIKNVTLAYMSDGDNLYMSASICNSDDRVNRKEGNRIAKERLEDFIKTGNSIGFKIDFKTFIDYVFPQTECTRSIFHVEPVTDGYFDIKYLRENCNFKCISNSFVHRNFKRYLLLRDMLNTMLVKLLKNKEI